MLITGQHPVQMCQRIFSIPKSFYNIHTGRAAATQCFVRVRARVYVLVRVYVPVRVNVPVRIYVRVRVY